MKVLFVSSGNIRGIVPFVKSQAESIKNEGIEVDYYILRGKGVLGYIKNIKKFRNEVKMGGYDIIHAHYGLIGFFCLLSFVRIPMVLSIMGSDISGHYDNNGNFNVKSVLSILLTQLALLFSNQIIVKSKNLERKVFFKLKCHTIPNGVDFNLFKPDSTKLNSDKKILFLANEESSVKNYKLVEESIQYLQTKNVELLNPYPIPHKEFPKYLNQSSVFVLSSFNEGSPNVIKEAMACNIPIVSTDVGDVSEVIGATSGCYISTYKPENFANKIDKALAYGKRTKGRNNIAHLEISRVAKRIIKVYNQALS